MSQPKDDQQLPLFELHEDNVVIETEGVPRVRENPAFDVLKRKFYCEEGRGMAGQGSE